MENAYFDKQLRAIMHILATDYAGLARGPQVADFQFFTQAAGVAWKEGKLDLLCFVRYVSQMLATTGDRNLKLCVTGPDYHPVHAGFDVRRFGDALFVTKVHEDTRFQAGDQIIKLNGIAPGEHQRRFQKNFLYADTPEREMWGCVLKMCDSMVVQRRDGSQASLDLKLFPGMRPKNRTYVEHRPGKKVILHLGSLDLKDAVYAVMQAHMPDFLSASQLILDLRGCSGEDLELLLPLVPFVLGKEKTPEEAFGSITYRTLMTRQNVAWKLEQLKPYRESEDVDSYARYLEERAGSGWCEETVTLMQGAQERMKPQGNNVCLLIDTYTESAAELFVQLALREKRARVIGRASMGSIDDADPIRVKISDTCDLIYPMSITKAAACGDGLQGVGIKPRENIPFTPDECFEDILLERAIS